MLSCYAGGDQFDGSQQSVRNTPQFHQRQSTATAGRDVNLLHLKSNETTNYQPRTGSQDTIQTFGNCLVGSMTGDDCGRLIPLNIVGSTQSIQSYHAESYYHD